MIYAYGVTQQGTYHIKNNIVCQDAHYIIKCSDSLAIAAVADGLGSEIYSDIAAKLAVKTACEYCSKKIGDGQSDEQIIGTIRDSFALAQKNIEKTASENRHDLDQYDTTLTLAILKNNTLYYGHSGDSGIVALTEDGLYEKVTEQQRDEESRVYPLYFGDEKWVFAKYPVPVASVLLATDGILETLFPVYIRNEPVSIYVALAKFFMDPKSLCIAEIGEEAVKQKIEKFIAAIPDSKVNDDKTVVVIVNTAVEVKLQPPEYYAEPDWQALKRKYDDEWRKAAYPHLYRENPSSGTGSNADSQNETAKPAPEKTSGGNDSNTTVNENTRSENSTEKSGADDMANKQDSGAAKDGGKGVFGKIFGKKDSSQKSSDQGGKV